MGASAVGIKSLLIKGLLIFPSQGPTLACACAWFGLPDIGMCKFEYLGEKLDSPKM